MEKENIKKQLHSMIDAIENEEQLKTVWMLMEPETIYKTTNWFKSLNEEDLSRLNKSIEQAERGEFIAHEEVEAKYKQWLKL